MQIVVDHVRACTYLIADGVLPGYGLVWNEARPLASPRHQFGGAILNSVVRWRVRHQKRQSRLRPPSHSAPRHERGAAAGH